MRLDNYGIRMGARLGPRGVRLAFVSGLVSIGLAAVTAPAQSVDLQAVADNTLYESSLGDLSNGQGANFFVGTTETGAIRRGLLRFDLSGLPSGAVVTSAKLSLSMTRTITGAEPVSLHAALASWGEGTSAVLGQGGQGAPAAAGDATWLYRSFPSVAWSTPGGDFQSDASSSLLVAGNGRYSWESDGLRLDVQRWLTDPSGNFGWVLVGDEGPLGTTKRFATREAIDAATRPVLHVEYVPGASGAWSLIGLIAIRRRRLSGTSAS